MTPYLPESAPFSTAQRAWLNGYFAAILTGGSGEGGLALPASTGAAALAAAPATQVPEEDFPWHDSAMPLAERLQLAEDKPYARKLMAAMAQLDCGACGYLCQTYSEAIARGDEKDLSKCSPGGADTAKALKRLMQIEAAAPSAAPATPAKAAAVATSSPASNSKEAAGCSRDNPLAARLVSSTQLTHRESPKDTRHVVIDLLDSELQYEPGDSLGILPQNDRDLVSAVIDLLGASGGETVTLASGKRTSLRHALTCEYTLGRCSPGLFSLLAEHVTALDEKSALEQLVAAEENPLAHADLAEVLERFASARPPLAEILNVLPRLQPRLYSISSSQRQHPNEVHLTVSVVRFEALGRWRSGVASNFLGVRSLPGDEVRVFLQRSPKFRLPTEQQTPIIMIGPGTGIAPFRAFLEERQAIRATGQCWLFFGNQHFEYDFLYKDELSQFLECGALTRLDLAFSRDSAEKIYVQDRMLEHGAELWSWLAQGANVFVCGDAKRMARDVHRTLQTIASTHGGLSVESAEQFMTTLAKDKRYHRDVY